MRKILFRGKAFFNGEWAYGSLVKVQDECVIIPEDAVYYGGSDFSDGWGVDPNTVGQFTGLTDKNGRRIFEGDFIHARHVDDSSLTAGVVNFILGCFCVRYNAYNNPAIDTLKEYEIIDNIHDNPELLKGGCRCGRNT